MAHVPNFDFDLFFSYASVDDEAKVPDRPETRWVSLFRKTLLIAVDRKLGRSGSVRDFFDRKDLTSNTVLSEDLRRALDRSAVFVAVNTPAYHHPKCACNLEREHFLGTLGTNPRDRSGQRRVWVVHLDEVPRATWQAAFFPDVRGMEFYLKDPDTGKIRPLPRGDDYQPFLDRVDDLAREIAERLEEMRTRSHSGPGRPLQDTASVPVAERPRVFLAETFGDPDGERLRLRNSLRETYTVLPETEYEDATYQEQARRDIEASIAFVQLLSPVPWKPGAYDMVQHRMAAEANKKVFRRRAPEVRIQEVQGTRQGDFILGPDVICAGFEDFKQHLSRELALLTAPPPGANPDNVPLVRFAIRAGDRDARADEVVAWLEGQGMLWEEMSVAESFSDRYRNEPCHGFMILCDTRTAPDGTAAAALAGAGAGVGVADPLRDRISECRQIQMTIKEPTRRPAVAVVCWPPPDPNWSVLLRSSALKLHRIRGDRPPELERFATEVRSVAP